MSTQFDKISNSIVQANLARWEPAHGRFNFRHPWKQYLNIGTSMRKCAYCIEALNSCINSEIQVKHFTLVLCIILCLLKFLVILIPIFFCLATGTRLSKETSQRCMHAIEHQFFRGPERIGHYNENSHQIIQDRFINWRDELSCTKTSRFLELSSQFFHWTHGVNTTSSQWCQQRNYNKNCHTISHGAFSTGQFSIFADWDCCKNWRNCRCSRPVSRPGRIRACNGWKFQTKRNPLAIPPQISKIMKPWGPYQRSDSSGFTGILNITKHINFFFFFSY